MKYKFKISLLDFSNPQPKMLKKPCLKKANEATKINVLIMVALAYKLQCNNVISTWQGNKQTKKAISSEGNCPRGAV